MNGRYQITERIATGGMAEIYKAKALGADGFEKVVVIKRILPEYTQDPEFVAMFVHEAKLSTRLSHPNIVQVFDLGKVGDDYFITMEYVDGPNLHATAVRSFKMGYKPFPLRECLFIVAEACKGLDHAHNKVGPDGRPLGIIHRDISPPNILLSFDGAVKVADFGVAKARDQAVRTRTGVLKGKFGYMSPEQATGKPIDRRSDVFSLGIVMWELLAGKRLFKGATPLQTVERVARCDVPLLATFFPDMPPEVDAICARALAPDPNDRFQSAGEFGEAISEYLFAAGLKVTSRDVSAFLRHLFMDERTPDGQPVWRPSPMPRPLPKPPPATLSTMTRTSATVVDRDAIAAWQDLIAAEASAEPSYSDRPTTAPRSVRYPGGTFLQMNPILSEVAPTLRGEAVLASSAGTPSARSNAVTRVEGTRRAPTAPAPPVSTASAPSAPAPSASAPSVSTASVSTAPAPSASTAPAPSASTAPAPAPSARVRLAWLWWSLASLALAGAMAALIYFSRRAA